MDESERAQARLERLRERNERRRARGKPTWDFEEYPPGYERRAETPALADPDQPTMVLPRERLEERPTGEEGRSRLAWTTAVFSLATGLSRVLGLAREIVAKSYFGVRGPVNAFEMAFLVPNTVRALVADAALSAAFVPVFSDLIEKGERKRAWRVASSLVWLTLLGLGGFTALFIVVAPWVMPVFYPRDHVLLVGLSQVLFPIVALLGLSGIVVGILNTYDEFSVPALTPVAWNLVIIAGLVFGIPRAHGIDHKLYVYAVSILVGTVVQVLLPVPWLRGKDGRLQMVIDWRDPAVRQVFRLMLPVTLGLGLININALIDGTLGSWLISRNAPASITAAFRIYMLPQGMFSVAVATVLFPSLSRFASRGDMDGFRRTSAVGLRQIAFLLVPASVVSTVLAEPIVRIIYQRHAFTPAQTPVVAACLAAFSVGLTFNGAMLMLNRSFFSLQENWAPTAVAFANLFVNAILDVAFSPLGIWGIPLGTSVVNLAGTVALVVLLRRRLGGIELGGVASSFARVLVASAAAGAVAYGLWTTLDAAVGRSFGGQVASLLPALVAATAVYLGACRALGVREMQALLSLRSRLRRG